MITNEVIAEQRLDRLAHIALYHQAGWMVILAILAIFKPSHYQEAIQRIAMTAFLSSLLASQFYIQARKKAEKFKSFSLEEGQKRKREHMIRFFCPYIFWGGCVALFSFF